VAVYRMIGLVRYLPKYGLAANRGRARRACPWGNRRIRRCWLKCLPTRRWSAVPFSSSIFGKFARWCAPESTLALAGEHGLQSHDSRTPAGRAFHEQSAGLHSSVGPSAAKNVSACRGWRIFRDPWIINDAGAA